MIHLIYYTQTKQDNHTDNKRQLNYESKDNKTTIFDKATGLKLIIPNELVPNSDNKLIGRDVSNTELLSIINNIKESLQL